MHGQEKASQFGGQIIGKGDLKYALAATDSFVAEVGPDEIFEVETELNIGGHLIHSLDDKLSHSDVTLPFVNPATELSVLSAGLGHAIFKAGSLYIIPKVFAALVVTIALALCLTYVVGKIEKLLTPWRQH